jgi:hypothetical protein
VGGAELVDFFVCEDAGADEKADAFGVFEREHAAAAGDYVEDELGVLPVFELAFAHEEGHTVDLAELDIGVAGEEFGAGVAHGRAAVAAAAGLVEHEFAVLGAELADEVDGGFGGENLSWKLDRLRFGMG